MGRLLRNINKRKKEVLLGSTSSARIEALNLTGPALESRLRKKRSPSYVKSMAKLDTGGVTIDKTKVEDLIKEIEQEFADLPKSSHPIGIIAKCYLGHPYEVHSLDCIFNIIKHYEKGEALPNGMEEARSLAIHPMYEFIEIYTDHFLTVKVNGDVSVIRR